MQEIELGSESLMALGDLIAKDLPYTLTSSTPHMRGIQPLIDRGYVTCDSDEAQVGSRITGVTQSGRTYYAELSRRKRAYEREQTALASAVSAAKFTALAAVAALIEPVSSVSERICDLLPIDDIVSSWIVVSITVACIAFVACLCFRFIKSDPIIHS